MTKRAFWVAGSVLLLSSCTGAGSLLGDVKVGWSFENAASCGDAKVSFVEIQMVNTDTGSTEYDQAFDCSDGRVEIGGLLPGPYTVTLSGLGADGGPRYEVSLQAEVSSGTVDLGQTTLGFILGNVTFYWAFQGVQDCMAAGVSQVQIAILNDQQEAEFEKTVSCTDRGATVTDFVRGNYTLVLYGLDVAHARLYQATVPLPVNIGDNQYGVIDLKSAVTTGTATLTWSFENGKDCAQAGINTVQITLSAPGGQVIFTDAPACASGTDTIASLQPGYYDLALEGLDQNGNKIYSAGPVRVEVNTGQNNLGNFDLTKL